MKKVLSLVLSLAMLLSITAGLDFSAYALDSTGQCGENVSWSFDSSTGTLTISGTGDMYNYYPQESPFYNSSIKSAVIENGITSIGGYAFSDCTSLTNVTIPNSVTIIGCGAFQACSSLTSVTISNSVTIIGNDAFCYCSSLTSVTIPNSVISIGENAFGLVNNIVYDGTASVSLWGAKAVNGYVDGYLVYKDSSKKELLGCSAQATTVTIPNSVTSIGDWAFYNCTSLTSVTIPNSVTSIGYGAFQACSSLTSVTISNSVTSIGQQAFYYCSSLASVTIPNSVTSIRDRAFYKCSSLTSVTIPNSVTSIGEQAFRFCLSLKNVFYSGSKSQWQRISIYYDNSSLTSAKIHYNSTGDHTWDSGTVTKQPTCTANGLKTYICTVCNETKDETITVPHTYSSRITQEATCTENGVKTFTCSVCSDSYTETLSALGHSFTNYVSDDNFTCTEDGTKTAKCDRCDVTDTVTDVGSANHRCVVISEKMTTCIAPGLIIYQCSACNEMFNEIVDELGHSFTNYVSDDNFTCTEDGTKTAKCDRCDVTDTVTDVGSALGKTAPDDKHNYELYDSTFTCSDGGIDIYKCSDCDNLKYVNINAGHSFTNYISDNNATCITDGTKTAKCDRCDVTDTKTVANSALGHNYASVVTAPTCTAKGYTTYTCKVCKYSYKGNYKNATGHKAVTDKAVAATCTKTGKTEGSHCSVCKAVIKKQSTVKAKGHSYDKGKVTTKPTASKTGVLTYTCTTCKAKKTEKLAKLTNVSGVKATGGSKSITVSWNKNTKMTGYEIQYSTDKNFKKAKTVKVTKNSTTKTTIKKLSSKKYYYVRVRTYKTINGTSCPASWSKAIKVKTK